MSGEVRQVNAHQFTVYIEGGPFDVEEVEVGEWYVSPAIGSEMSRNAGITNRFEAEEFARQTTWGPYGSQEEAIASLDGATW